MAQGDFPRESVGVTAFFLGSSVTFGSASGGVSFVEMLGERLGWTAVKEAVSGTTLANLDENSYPARLRRRLPDVRPDLFVCQLSTNDAARGVPLGEPGAQEATVAGAIESVVRLARGAWGCPVWFYTSPRFDSAAYGAMVALLNEMAPALGVRVLDLWNDAAFNALDPAQRARYMADPVHPTLEGYRDWWTPRFAEALASSDRRVR